MADYPIYRLVKGTQLTFTEMDDNLRWLSQNMSGSQVTITGSTISMTGSVIIDGDLQVYGTASIGFLNTVAFSTGSNQLGNDTLDTQTLIGRVNISGSMVVSGSAVINNLTGSLYGTSSWAQNAVTASYVLNAVSASYVSGSAAFVTNLTSSNDARINGLKVGAGLGIQWTVFGVDAGSNASANIGVAVGYKALSSSIANGGTAVGRMAARDTTTGVDNTAIGSIALLVNTTGNQNTAVGAVALADINGDYNTGVGNNVLSGVTSGNYNTAIGRLFNTGLVTANYNTIIGAQIAGLPSTLSNNIILADGQGNIKYRWDATQTNIYGNLAVTGSVIATTGFTGSLFGTASWAINALTASSADNLYVRGSLTASAALITGTITAQTLVVQTVTSSVIYSSGSNRFGNELTNQQTFTGSVSITGSLSVKDIPQGNYSNVVVLDTASGNFYVTASSGIGSISPIAVIQNTNLYSIQPKAAVPGVAAINSIYLGSGSGEGINDNDSVNSVIIGFQAGGGSENSDAQNSTWIGYQAGYNASYAERSVLIGYQAGALDGLNGPELNDSNFLGYQAGYSSSFAYQSNFLGYQAGYSASDASDSNFLGTSAGYAAEDASDSNFIGSFSGFQAYNAQNSNFLGQNSGQDAINAGNSNFLGQRAGFNAASASFSNLFGYRAGANETIGTGIGSNNIVIGTNISLPDGTVDSINLGAIIFATGSYSDSGNFIPFDGAVTNGRVGINTSTPTFNFDVSGSGRYTNGLQVTGSLRAPIITGSLFGTSSWSQNSVTASNFAGTGSNGFVSNMSDTYTGTAKITDIVTLSSAEYSAIVSPLTSTLYIII
jgi:hypothetical protein